MKQNVSATVLLACVSIAAGCGPSEQAGPILATRTDPLASPDGAILWPQAATIPVCWVLTGFDTEKTIIVDALANTWEAHGAVNFTGFQACPTTGTDQFVRARVELDPNSEWGGGSATVGMAALQSPTTDTNVRSVHIVLPANGHTGRTEYLAVHEFGHTLGFMHEQDRADNSDAPDPTCNPTGSISGTYYSAYDSESIMHYCNSGGNISGRLSASDESAVGLVYGPSPHWPLSQSISYTGNTGAYTNVTRGWSNFGISSTGNHRIRFHYDNATVPSPSWMTMDIQMTLDGPVVATVTNVPMGSYTFDQTFWIGAGNHTASFRVRSHLVGGPPGTVTMTGAPAWIDVEGASTWWF